MNTLTFVPTDRKFYRLTLGLLVFLALLLSACQGAGSGPVLGETFELKPGEQVVFDDAGGLVVKYAALIEDSRCPADAMCAVQGEALISVVLELNGESLQAELKTGGGEAGQASLGGFTVVLQNLEPYPLASQPVAPSDTVATFVVNPG
jgi:hypothetical protein